MKHIFKESLVIVALLASHTFYAETVFDLLISKPQHYDLDGLWNLTSADNIFFLWNKSNPEHVRRPSFNEKNILSLNQEIGNDIGKHKKVVTMLDDARKTPQQPSIVQAPGSQPMVKQLEQEEKNLDEALTTKTAQLAQSLSTAAGLYKIHLMPKPEYIQRVVERLTKEITTNPSFEPLVDSMKVTVSDVDTDPAKFKELDEHMLLDDTGNILPIIVIYPTLGKAQAVLEHIAPLFADVPGLQLKDLPGSVHTKAQKTKPELSDDSLMVPRFNTVAKTRDARFASPFIYYAQGNADEKVTSKKWLCNADTPLFKYVQPLEGSAMITRDQSGIKGPLARLLFDARENFALYRPDFLGSTTDFHLYLPLTVKM